MWRPLRGSRSSAQSRASRRPAPGCGREGTCRQRGKADAGCPRRRSRCMTTGATRGHPVPQGGFASLAATRSFLPGGCRAGRRTIASHDARSAHVPLRGRARWRPEPAPPLARPCPAAAQTAAHGRGVGDRGSTQEPAAILPGPAGATPTRHAAARSWPCRRRSLGLSAYLRRRATCDSRGMQSPRAFATLRCRQAVVA